MKFTYLQVSQVIWGTPSSQDSLFHGKTKISIAGWFTVEKYTKYPIYKWMMTGGSPILRHPRYKSKRIKATYPTKKTRDIAWLVSGSLTVCYDTDGPLSSKIHRH